MCATVASSWRSWASSRPTAASARFRIPGNRVSFTTTAVALNLDGPLSASTKTQDRTLNQIKNGDYLSFAKRKLAENRLGGLPPYSCASILRSTSPTQQNNINFLSRVENILRGKKNIFTIGPLPSFISKTKGSYKHSLYIQTSNRVYLNRVLTYLAKEIDDLKESKKVRWSFDIDPVDFS